MILSEQDVFPIIFSGPSYVNKLFFFLVLIFLSVYIPLLFCHILFQHIFCLLAHSYFPTYTITYIEASQGIIILPNFNTSVGYFYCRQYTEIYWGRKAIYFIHSITSSNFL